MGRKSDTEQYTSSGFLFFRGFRLPVGKTLHYSVSSTTGGRMQHAMTTTAFELEGYAVRKNLGIVRGITVRSRSIIGSLGASLQTLIGGNISLFTELCERAREEAFELMLQHAAQMGANAIIGVRYDATEVMQGVSEVLCYGTAVVVEQKS